MEILLHDDIAAACKGRVFAADDRRLPSRLSSRILRAVDEAHHIAVVEIAETVHLVDHGDHIPDAVHDLHSQFEAEVHTFGANVKEDVARSGYGMASAGANLPKRVKLGGTGGSEELVPGIGTESCDAGKACLDVAKLHSAYQPGQIRTKGQQTRVGVLVLANAQHQEDRRPRKRTDHSLRKNDLVELAGCIHFFNPDLRWPLPKYLIFARTVTSAFSLAASLCSQREWQVCQ